MPSRLFRLLLASAVAALPLLAAPSARADDPPPLPITNPGFENGLDGWTISKDDQAAGVSKASAEAAHSGQAGLLVKQAEGGPGSWAQTAKVPIEGGKTYRLSYWARCVDPSGVGIWIQIYGADGKVIPPSDPKAGVALVPEATKEWSEFKTDIVAPPGAAYITLAIHAFSKRACNAYFDDIVIIPVTTISQGETPGAAPTAAAAAPAPPAVAAQKGPVKTLVPPPDAGRVKEIAAALPAVPKGVGPTLGDRKAWDALGADAEFRSTTISRAERFLSEPIPDIAAAYAESVRTGDRKVDDLVTRRRFRLAHFVLAEGMENKGRFLSAADKELQAICSESSWILSGHSKFTTVNDLGTAMTSWNLATAVAMLGDRLPEATRKMVHDAVLERVVNPYLEEIRGTRSTEWWANNPNNWNAVVHGGIVGAALALDESVQDRAEVVAAVEQETQYYIKGFPADGYSLEGMGYWKYGFGHYVLASEAVYNATGGKVSLYSRDNIRLVAQFPRRFAIAPLVYPAYSDAPFNDDPCLWLYDIIDHRYGFGDGTQRTLGLDGMFCTFLYAWGINMAFDPAEPPVAAEGAAAIRGHRIRDWFPNGEVLVSRPITESADGLGFSMKGGNNGTSHGHDDLGTYVVVVGKEPLVVDPGAMIYDGRTFSSERYKIPINNSYGHDVPRVAGQLQKEGAQHAASIVSTDFTDAADTLVVNLKKGYDVPALTDLVRRYEYSRAGNGSLTVSDKVTYSSPQEFGTALVTLGEAAEEKPGVWTISWHGKTVRAEIDAGGLPFAVTNEVLKDPVRAGKVRRLGIDLTAPAAMATITVKLTPVAGTVAAQ